MLKVLLADDNKITAHGLKEMIEARAGNAVQIVDVAYNGKQALKSALRFQPNAVITDIKMPIMDGLTLIAELKKIMPGVELIIISSYGEFEYAKKAMEFGVTNFILKPLDSEKIESILKHLQKLDKKLNKISAAIDLISDSETAKSFTHALKDGIFENCRAVLDKLTEKADNDFLSYRQLVTDLCAILFNFTHKFNIPDKETGSTLEQTAIEINKAGSIGRIREIIDTLCENVCKHITANKNFGAEQLSENIRKYIAANYTSPDISLDRIASSFNISQSYLCAIFKKYNFMSVTTLITELRIQKACELLKQTSLTVNDVAKKCGYYDAHYFMRVFKKYFGFSPSEYRKKLIQGDVQ